MWDAVSSFWLPYAGRTSISRSECVEDHCDGWGAHDEWRDTEEPWLGQPGKEKAKREV